MDDLVVISEDLIPLPQGYQAFLVNFAGAVGVMKDAGKWVWALVPPREFLSPELAERSKEVAEAQRKGEAVKLPQGRRQGYLHHQFLRCHRGSGNYLKTTK